MKQVPNYGLAAASTLSLRLSKEESNKRRKRRRSASDWDHKEYPSPFEKEDIVAQQETQPISQEQLVAEVKGIYAGLVMVEAKCIEVDSKQTALTSADPGTQPELNNEQWQALIALHRTLLHEHHDSSSLLNTHLHLQP